MSSYCWAVVINLWCGSLAFNCSIVICCWCSLLLIIISGVLIVVCRSYFLGSFLLFLGCVSLCAACFRFVYCVGAGTLRFFHSLYNPVSVVWLAFLALCVFSHRCVRLLWCYDSALVGLFFRRAFLLFFFRLISPFCFWSLYLRCLCFALCVGYLRSGFKMCKCIGPVSRLFLFRLSFNFTRDTCFLEGSLPLFFWGGSSRLFGLEGLRTM